MSGMRTVIRCSLVCAVLLVYPAAAWTQENPCAVAMATVADPTRFYLQASELTATLPDGTPVITAVQIGVFTPMANPDTDMPVVPLMMISKAAFTPVPGVPGCYRGPAADSAPEGMQPNVEYVLAARYTDGFQFGPWTVSNRFVLRSVAPRPQAR